MYLTRDFEKKKSEGRYPEYPPVLLTAGNAPPWWQARAGFLQWKALWLLAGTPLVWLNGCQLCQGDGRAGVSPLIETSPSSEPLTLREQDLCQSTPNLVPNRWKQPQVRWRSANVMQPITAAYRSKERILLSPELHQGRWCFLRHIQLLNSEEKVLWTSLWADTNLVSGWGSISNQAREIKLFGISFANTSSYLCRLSYRSLHYSTRPERLLFLPLYLYVLTKTLFYLYAWLCSFYKGIRNCLKATN